MHSDQNDVLVKIFALVLAFWDLFPIEVVDYISISCVMTLGARLYTNQYKKLLCVLILIVILGFRATPWTQDSVYSFLNIYTIL